MSQFVVPGGGWVDDQEAGSYVIPGGGSVGSWLIAPVTSSTETGTVEMAFTGFSMSAGAGGAKTTSAIMAFGPLNFNAHAQVIDVIGTGLMSFGLFTIRALGLDPGARGQGLRQFWTR